MIPEHLKSKAEHEIDIMHICQLHNFILTFRLGNVGRIFRRVSVILGRLRNNTKPNRERKCARWPGPAPLHLWSIIIGGTSAQTLRNEALHLFSDRSQTSFLCFEPLRKPNLVATLRSIACFYCHHQRVLKHVESRRDLS